MHGAHRYLTVAQYIGPWGEIGTVDANSSFHHRFFHQNWFYDLPLSHAELGTRIQIHEWMWKQCTYSIEWKPKRFVNLDILFKSIFEWNSTRKRNFWLQLFLHIITILIKCAITKVHLISHLNEFICLRLKGIMYIVNWEDARWVCTGLWRTNP